MSYRKRLSIITLLFILIFTIGSPAIAAAANPVIDLPSQVAIEKDDDVSAGLLSNLLGPVWRATVGGSASDSMGGMGRYSGIIAVVLGATNAAAMIIVSAGILYMWGIFAVNTAHQGKQLGGSVYNSLWVPVRHAMSFSLCVPVLNGYSLLQIMMLAMVSLGINFGNTIWDEAGSYIVDNTQTAIMDSPPPFINNESMRLVEPMFQTAVAYEILKAYGEEPSFSAPKTSGSRKIYALNRDYVAEYNPNAGYMAIYLMPQGYQSLGEAGGVKIPVAKPPAKDADADTTQVYRAQFTIAEARGQAVIAMWDELRAHARYYLAGKVLDREQPAPSSTGLDIARAYRDKVMDTAMTQSAAIREGDKSIKSDLEKALDSKNGKSQMGWVSAGLFSHTLSQAQRRIDAVIYTGGSTFLKADGIGESGWAEETVGAAKRFFTYFRSTSVVLRENKGIIEATHDYSNNVLLQGRVYDPVGSDDDGPSTLNKLIAEIFLGGGVIRDELVEGGTSGGILKSALESLKDSDPIVVMSKFGNRLYVAGVTTGTIATGGSVIGGLVSAIPGIGSALGAAASNFFTSPLVTAITMALIICGILLKFIAPLTPLIIWAYAIVNWLLRVVEALIAAPLWAIAHAFPEGDGFSGQHARKGYVLMLDLAMRPVLMVIGSIFAIAIWIGTGILLNILFSKAFNGFTTFVDKDFDTEIILAVLVFSCMYVIHTKIFVALVLTFPNRIMDWVGQFGAQSMGEDSSAQETTGSATRAVNKVIGGMHRSPTHLKGKPKPDGENEGMVGPGGGRRLGGGGSSPAQMSRKEG